MIVSIIASVLYYVLLVFLLAMWARFIFDWVRVLSRNWRPKGFLLVVAEASYTVTDPPIRAIRKIIPPLRIGGAAIDFGWTIVLIACIILMQIMVAIA
ncbi:YggT family protein [Ruicaihuangia caeni]|uniref:YggT family protein n=1 Tax=Ruicaihuangia caeni TaxID=3042517 RepID=A0AAW6T567_9MICO|nr:YggT family protein [Klugiella sp. YN-L-19]MDI2098236.1 YggT family protein [Klugiella sp. YN-L-19]